MTKPAPTTHLILHLRDGAHYITTHTPTWAKVENTLRCLDGVQHDDAILEYVRDGVLVTCLNIGGGENQRVVVGIRENQNDPIHHLIIPAQGEGLCSQSIGEQETSLPAKFFVPIDIALQAVYYFYQHQQMTPTLHWTP